MQFQADMIKTSIDRPLNIESTALGAGMLAGLGTGFWSHTGELINVRKIDRIFTANMDAAERSALLMAWGKAVKKAKHI